MDCNVSTVTMASAVTLTNSYALMQDELQTVDGTNKWLQLYGESQTTLEITYTTGAAETSNYVEFYIEFGSGSVNGSNVSTMTWVRETVEFLDESADQVVLEEWTYKIDGAAAGTAYTKRIQLPVCTKGIRIYAKEVGVAANYGNLTIKANTQSIGAGVYNRSLQTVVLEAGDIEIGAVELKNSSTDDRAVIKTASTAAVSDLALVVSDPVVAAGTSIPTTLTGGSKTVAAAGTAEALGASLATKSIYIRAKAANTSFICVGDSAVDKTTNQQIVLYANDSVTLDIANRATVYIDADVNAEGVDYMAMS